ncbi:MAG: hypothetical protein KAJ79_05005, partial [Candidatus Omnitrophica bacterium]|nr:hypothetical protein [Candidatus Omnitrophota bacterium]
IYITPIKKFGLLGKINLGMIETGDISVEKTTWTLSMPDNYSYFRFKTNMDEIDLSMIEAEKTLELAKEYKYWSNLASSAIGELQKQAVSNQAKVKIDYDNQFDFNRSVQSSLNTRIGNNKFNQNLVQTAQSKNTEMVNEAAQIMKKNKPVSQRIKYPDKAGAAGQSINGRRNVKGWQFKINDFRGEKQVKESINNYLVQEDTKQSMQAQQIKRDQTIIHKHEQRYIQSTISDENDELHETEPAVTSKSISHMSKDSYIPKFEKELSEKTIKQRRRLTRFKKEELQRFDNGLNSSYAEGKKDFKNRRETGTQYGYSSSSAEVSTKRSLDAVGGFYDKEERFKVISGEEMPEELGVTPSDKPVSPLRTSVPQKFAPKIMVQKKSALLKGFRSIDIPIPNQGRKFSFKKLGSNPTLTIYYRKKSILSKIFFLLLCISAVFGSFKIRKYNPPLDKIINFFKNIKLINILNRIIDSKAFKIINFIIMIASLISGSPLFVITLGFASIYFIRFVSAKRYARIGYVPHKNIKKFFKDMPSNLILILFALSFFEKKFLFLIGITTFVNFILAVIYGICTLFTPKITIEKEEKGKETDSL